MEKRQYMKLNAFQKSGNWLKKCTDHILSSENQNPFPKPPIAANFYNNPPLFCFGRDEQKNEISIEILDSISSFEPKLIRIMGKQGIGKSTLICSAAIELSQSYPLPIVYLETSGQPEDFKMRSLYRQVIAKMENSEIIKTLVINSIRKFISFLKNSGGRLYEHLSNKLSGEEISKISNDPDYIRELIKNSMFNQKLFDLVSSNAMILMNHFLFDLNFLLVFWKAHVQNSEILHSLNAFKGGSSFQGFSINTDNDASKYLDDLIELIRWSFDDKSTLVLIFDHLEAGTSQMSEKVYSNLFSILLNLRQKKHITIILSGTLDAYNEIDKVLEEDQNLQLDNWSKTIALTNLDPSIVIQIINKYLSIFWGQFNIQPPPDKALFPFGENSIKYLYENNGLDLRKTLKNLYNLIQRYKRENRIELVDTFFKAFKAFRLRDDVALSYIEQRELVKKILNPSIQDKNRSTMVEFALCDFFKILMANPDYKYLTDVKHEPPLGKSNKKPDVFLEFFGNQGIEYIKKVGIEVKIYRKGDKVSKRDIEKTYVLLEENAVDYVSWITNVPLDLKHRYNISEELEPHLGRISALNDRELAYISYMVYFKEIFNTNPSVEQAEFILNRLDISPLSIKETLKDLPKLTIPAKIEEKEKDLTEFVIPPSETAKIKTYANKSKITSKQKKKISAVEIGIVEIKNALQAYIEKKSKNITRITSANTIKAIKKRLNLDQSEEKWDEDIWTNALDMGKKAGYRATPKTIFFE